MSNVKEKKGKKPAPIEENTKHLRGKETKHSLVSEASSHVTITNHLLESEYPIYSSNGSKHKLKGKGPIVAVW
jgi:hypothetical protein